MLILRPAALADAQLLFDWRNDPVARQASHDSEALSFDTHLAWLAATLSNPARRLFVAEDDGLAVGTVRADLESDAAVLSWNVAPAARGRGIATEMVKLVFAELPEVSWLRAEVKIDNVASAKVARAAGMELVRQDGSVLHFARELDRCRQRAP